MGEKKVLKLADNGRRFVAGLIDNVLPMICSAILFTSFGQFFGSIAYYDSYYYRYGHHPFLSIGLFGIMVIIGLSFIVVEIIFFARSQSIGKAIMGLKVVKASDGEPVGIWMMLLREFIVKKASRVFFWLGFIWIFIDKKHRAWHDLILETYVIDCKDEKKKEPVEFEVPASPKEPSEANAETKEDAAMDNSIMEGPIGEEASSEIKDACDLEVKPLDEFENSMNVKEL